jgi:biopolymer transport protein ExbB
VVPILSEFLDNAGPLKWPMLVTAGLAIQVVLERGLALYVHRRLDSSTLLDQARLLLELEDLPEAIGLCEGAPRSMAARVVKAGLGAAGQGRVRLEQAVEEASVELIAPLGRRIPLLAMLANVAMLMGLLGSVEGLIMGFENVAYASPETKQVLLAARIGSTLWSTLAGLSVAVPALIASSIFKHRAACLEAEVRRVQAATVRLVGESACSS